jgi:hypothetical protein
MAAQPAAEGATWTTASFPDPTVALEELQEFSNGHA